MNHWKSLLFILSLCGGQACAQLEPKQALLNEEKTSIVLGNQRMEEYLPLLKDKKVAFVGNHSSKIGATHIVDSLLSIGVELVGVFSPEHGFRGEADAGEKVNSEVDKKTQLSITSLYGSNKKPTVEQLKGVDIILFDIQDVGARFYTYISTLHYVMEAAAEQNIPVIVLDRPNPNGHYVDGPVLQEAFNSFVGLHPIPVVHGMTIGEYAQMTNGQAWLNKGVRCDLKVISCLNYDHKKKYVVAVPPSPNLPNMKAIYLYPSLCFFEGTVVSVGRGTKKPFQQIGHPALDFEYSFTPKSSFGAKHPKLEQQLCKGVDFSTFTLEELGSRTKLDLSYLLAFYEKHPSKDGFFTNFFNLLAGNNRLQQNIVAGKSEKLIRAEWEEELENFKAIRKQYLLYDDFE